MFSVYNYLKLRIVFIIVNEPFISVQVAGPLPRPLFMLHKKTSSKTKTVQLLFSVKEGMVLPCFKLYTEPAAEP